MFIFPVLLSLSLDIAVVAVYFREGNLYGREKGQPWVRLLDVSACNFDLAVLATLRILFISPYIYSYVHRRRLVYTFLPWAWEALNMGIVTARLVFLVAILVASRAEYLLVGLSFASILLQAVCLEHLRSSAPREKHIFLTSALSRVDASTRLLEHHQPAAPGAGGQDLYDGHRRDVDFIASITAKMKRAKEYWTAKTESLRGLWNDLGRARGGEAAAFNLLLRLFTYEDVLGDMDEAFAQEPSSVEFYIPQLATFLLYGAFWSSGSLQAFLLDKSARSIQFAHRLYWFLLASCLDGSGIDQEGRRQVGTLIEEVRSRGQRAARRLEQGRTVQELYPPRGSSSALQRPPQASRRWGRGTRSRDSYFSKDRASSATTTSASSLGRAPPPPPGGGDAQEEGTTYVDVARLGETPQAPSWSPSEQRDAQRASASSPPLPPPVRLSGPSAPGGDSPYSPVARFPLHLCRYQGPDDDMFGVLPRFLDALVLIARSLGSVPRERRTPNLRVSLRELGRRLLPSNLVYVPVGNPYNRVWRLHASESFAFSTKERVPCLVCLEVVDYAPSPRRHGPCGGEKGGGRKWWKQVMDGVGEGMPSISHTFKFGDKEWTLKIGEARREEEGEAGEETRGGEADERDGTAQLGKWEPLLPADPSMVPDVPRLMRRVSSSVGVDGLAATLDAGGMGQWASEVAAEGGEEGRREGGEHVLLNVSQLRQAQEQGQCEESKEAQRGQGTIASPEAVGGKAEWKGEAGLGEDLSESALGAAQPAVVEDYGTFSPGTSPGKRRLERAREGRERERGRGRGSPRTEVPSPVHTDTSGFGGQGAGRRSGSSSGTLGMEGLEAKACDPSSTLSPAAAAVQPPVIFKERWKEKEARLRGRSEIGHLPGWRLVPVIVKANDDLRQEQFASQLLGQIAHVLRQAEVPVWIRPYGIIATSFDGGLIEAIPDTVSLDALRRNDPSYTTLPDFFQRFFGARQPDGELALARARQCFLESLAAYSIVCFLLQVKDRHNGNILLDAEGHVIHIDFGFLLASSPGNVKFERAPFKLTAEMVDVLGGPRSAAFRRFRELCVKTFLELRRQRHKIILLVEMAMNANDNLPCFGGRPAAAVEALRQRFQPELNDRACGDFVNGLIDDSVGSWSTRWYDVYQRAFVL